MNIDPLEVKRDSERIIQAAGGKTINWLPTVERQTAARTKAQLISRALVVNALINIHFGAPVAVIDQWLSEHGLKASLSAWERGILAKSDDELTEQDITNLYWYNEALWALMWAGALIDKLPVDCPVEDSMVAIVPNLEQGEGPQKFVDYMTLRDGETLYRMLDLYFRAHWYARDGALNGYSTGTFNLSIIHERRRALEWLLDSSSDWDHTNDST